MEQKKGAKDMNKIRRNKLNEAIKMLYAAQEIINECRDEEEDAFCNLPDSLQGSERGESMEEAIDNMEDANSGISDAICTLDEMLYNC